MPFGMGVEAVLIMLLVWVGIPGSLFYLGLRAVRAMERRSPGAQQQAELSERLLRLEERIESLAGDVEKAIEGQQFTSRLLEGRERRSEGG